MKKLLINLAICSTLPLCATTAFGAGAQTRDNYVSVNGAVTFLQDADLSEPFAAGKLEFKTGWGVGAAVGHDFGMVRAELEVAYRDNDIDKLDINSYSIAEPTLASLIPNPVTRANFINSVALGSHGAGGDISSVAVMVNGYYDFKNSSPVTPYLMGGIGYANVKAHDLSATLTFPGFGDITSHIGSDNDNVFAYQLGAGIGYKATDQIILDLAYRYFATTDPKFGETDAHYRSHNINFGLRVLF